MPVHHATVPRISFECSGPGAGASPPPVLPRLQRPLPRSLRDRHIVLLTRAEDLLRQAARPAFGGGELPCHQDSARKANLTQQPPIVAKRRMGQFLLRFRFMGKVRGLGTVVEEFDLQYRETRSRRGELHRRTALFLFSPSAFVCMGLAK